MKTLNQSKRKESNQISNKLNRLKNSFCKLIFTIILLASIKTGQAQTWNNILPSNFCNQNNDPMQGIYFLDDLTGYVGGYNGLIMKTIDGGVHWVCQITNTLDHIASIYFIDKNTGFAVGDNGLAISTQDGGLTWTPMNIPAPVSANTFRSVRFYNAFVGFIVGGVSGNSGTVLKTLNGGLTWMDFSPTNGNVIYGVYFVSPLIGYTCDWNGVLMQTIDGGVNWTNIYQAPVGYHLWNIAQDELGNRYVVAGNYNGTGMIIKSTMGGLWLPDFTTNKFLIDISFIGNTGYVSGSDQPGSTNGIIYKSTGNSIWLPQPSNPAIIPGIIRLSLPCTHTGYACGTGGIILKMENTGQEECCADFMTDVMNFGIQDIPGSGNNHQFCLSPNVTSNDIVLWDLDCDGSLNAPSATCANFTLVPGNSELCVTILHPNAFGDTCRVKLKTCLPSINLADSCTCDSTIFNPQIDAGFTWMKTSPFTVLFTQNYQVAPCDTVHWDFDDGSAVGSHGESVSHTFPSQPGTYNVCMWVNRTDIFANAFCTRKICISITLDGSALTTNIIRPELLIKPNPGSNFITVTVPSNYSNNENILDLTSVDGKVLISTPIEQSEVKLNIENLSSGIYFVVLKGPKGQVISQVSKIIKY